MALLFGSYRMPASTALSVLGSRRREVGTAMDHVTCHVGESYHVMSD